MPEMDFTGVEPTRGGVALAPGVYKVRIKSAESMVSAKKQTPGIELELVVEGGPEAGSMVRDTLWLTPKAASMNLWRLQSVGINPTGKFTLEPQMLVGRVFEATVRHEAYVNKDGEPRNKPVVASWDPVAAGGSDIADDFAREFGATVVPAGTAGDDDIPF